MYFNKVTSSVVSAMFLLLILSSVNVSSIKLANAAEGDLVNYNNNFNTYSSPNDPNKDSAMQNADCVVNFMQTYVYAASSAQNCNNPSSTQQPQQQPSTDQNQFQGQPQYQRQYQPQSGTGQGFQNTDGPQTGTPGQSGDVGVVKVVDGNGGSGVNSGNTGTFAPVQSTSFATPHQNNGDDNNDDKNTKDNDNNNNNNNGDDNNDDKNTKDNDNNNNNNNGDDNNDSKDKKVYNEKTVSKDERKLLLTTCFERGYDKGDYLSTGEIVKCAKNYNT